LALVVGQGIHTQVMDVHPDLCEDFLQIIGRLKVVLGKSYGKLDAHNFGFLDQQLPLGNARRQGGSRYGDETPARDKCKFWRDDPVHCVFYIYASFIFSWHNVIIQMFKFAQLNKRVYGLILLLVAMSVLAALAGNRVMKKCGFIETFEGGSKRKFRDSSKPLTVFDIVAGSPSPTWKTDEIPFLIHQTAPTDPKKWKKAWLECQKSWKEILPQFKYVLWNDEEINNFIKTKFPGFHSIFLDYPYQIQRADAIRYFILYEYGGIYADMDYMVLKDFTGLIPIGKASISESPHGNEGLQNALMISPAKHPFWLFAIEELLKYYYSNKTLENVLESTGPQIVVRAAKIAGPQMMHPLPEKQFNPLKFTSFMRHNGNGGNKNDDLYDIDVENTYTVHLGTCSYCGPPVRTTPLLKLPVLSDD
jgi:mannosyltransferase OCH1-like enzyme